MKKNKHIKLNGLKLGMIFLVFSMFVGFAALNTNLVFNGTANLAYLGDQDFRIYFSRAFINGVGKSNIINDEKNAFTVTYSEINRKDADLTYTVKNTSNSYYADVEVNCKARKNDGTSFLYAENEYESQRFRLEPGRSLTKDIKLLLPETIVDSPTSDLNINLEEYIKGLSKGKDDNINFNNLNENGVYESTNTNSGKSVYYYRGSIANNDVIFAGKCWKILRTSENGGVKLVYNGNTVGGTCLEFGAALGIQSSDDIIEIDGTHKYNNNAYAGYMYGGLNASDYLSAHQNINDSVFKQRVDEWYEASILNTVYEQYVVDDVYNNDRTILEDYSNITSTSDYEGLGYGTHTALYGSAGRTSFITKNLLPTYKVSNKNDAFSVSDTTNGNGDLTYPIGMLSADELVYAGVTKESSTKSWMEAYARFILTMSPVGYYNNTMNYVALSGRKLSTYPNDLKNEKVYILPTLTVSSELNIVNGDGSSSNPFVLSSEDIYENSYTCTLNVNNVGYSEDLEPRNPLLDLEVGEEYCFGEECFYTLSNDQKGTIKMISKYNLYVGRIYSDYTNYTNIDKQNSLYGKQHYTAVGTPISNSYPHVGTVPYSNSTNDNTYANSVVKPYVDEYGEYLRKLTGLNIKSELITRDELVDLGCVVLSKTDGNCANPNFDWVTSSTYWTMTPENNTVYLVGSDGYFKAPTNVSNLTAASMRGVRPVITVSVATKNPDVTFVTGNGENVGDELCIGNECFYVLNYDGDNYTLFSKYNLYVGNKFDTGGRTPISTSSPEYGKQNSLALGDKGTPVYGTLNYTDSITAINNYVTYLNTTFNLHVTGRAITLKELEDPIGCRDLTGSGINHGCSKEKNPLVQYEWVTNTTYWTGATSGNNVYIVGGDGFFKAVATTNQDNRGARPVIIVPATEIKSPDYVVPSTSYPSSWDDKGVFSEYYEDAYAKLKTMSTEEKVGQLLVMSYTTQEDAVNAVSNYNVGGVLFFEGAFTGKTVSQVQEMTSSLQVAANIPLMMAVDEEGGRVVRISPNLNLVSEEKNKYPNLFFTNSNNKNAWKLASTLYTESGNNFNLIIQEEQVRNNLLKKLGINMNFAPVVDIATPPAYISDRSFGNDPELVAQYAEAVIGAGKGSGVSHSLKHFPGYGNNQDTHSSSSVDETSMEDLKNIHLVPFVAGINAGANSVMISHNTVAALDKANPASLSYPVHSLLFDELGFTGIAITDDLSMKAISENVTNQYVKAFTAGNHILLSSDQYATAYNEILKAVNDGNIPMTDLNKRVFKILAWKYYNGMLS